MAESAPNDTYVRYINGDLFTSNAQVLGHGVNVIGKMGAGIAKTLRHKYPEVFEQYQVSCKNKSLQPGGMLSVLAFDGKWILNLASQDKIGKKCARIEWVQSSLILALEFCKLNNLHTLALPRIGSGLGGLLWTNVKDLIERTSRLYPQVQIEVCEWE